MDCELVSNISKHQNIDRLTKQKHVKNPVNKTIIFSVLIKNNFKLNKAKRQDHR